MRLAPTVAAWRVEWAAALASVGEYQQAARQLKTAISLRPEDSVHSWRMLSRLLFWHLGRPHEALEILTRIANQTTESYDYELLAECFARTRDSHGSWKETSVGSLLDRMARAVGVSPDQHTLLHAVAAGLMRMGRHDESAELARAICDRTPNDPDALCTLGWALTFLGRPTEATRHFEHAWSSVPENHYAAWSLRRNLHSVGQYERARDIWMTSPQLRAEAHAYRHPAEPWSGERLANKTIRLRHEHNFGFGDAIQFARSARWLSDHGATVVVVTRQPLVSLMARTDGVDRAFTRYDDPGHADHDCPGAVPWMLLNVPMSNVAHGGPYLRINQQDLDRQHRAIGKGNTLAVGVAWETSDARSDFRRRPLCGPRSIPLVALSPLSRISGVRLYSLQKKVSAETPQTPATPALVPLVDLTNELTDFYDMAVLTAAMDVVITADTSIAHLAGALGRPTIVLLPYAASWLWEIERNDSAWYPTVSVVRQAQPGIWSTPISQVVSSLEQMRLEQMRSRKP